MFIMMKLILSLTVIWALFSTAEALQCILFQSILQNCSSSETSCITASIQASSSGTSIQRVFQGCASSSLCPTSGSQTFSANLGSFNAIASVQCCNTDNCNSQTLPVPNVPANNSLQCFTCNPVTGHCNSTLQCRGEENRCFQASLMTGNSNFSAFGCASSNLCAAAASLGSVPFLQSAGNFSSGPTCCETSLCNDACCFRLGMINLLLGLLIYTLY